MVETPGVEARMSVTEPLGRAWNWMVTMLFRPFDLGKWMVVGFSAWLAGLASGKGGGGGVEADLSDGDGLREVVSGVQGGWEWLTGHSLAAGIIFAAILTLLALILLILWVSSRGKFIFLDNVVRNRAEIAGPWKRFRRLGNSLFAFRLIVGLLFFPLALGVVGLFGWLAVGPDGWAHLEGPAAWAGVLGTAVLGCSIIVTAILASLFLDAFVVPLMHRYDLRVLAAWRRFFALMQGRVLWFLAWAMFVLLLALVTLSAILVTGFMTCCLGFFLLAVPYVGTVLLLPLIVGYRAFTVEFLAQVDPAFRLDGEGQPA